MSFDWRRLELLFQQALEEPCDEVSAFLDRECADEPALRHELEAMLAAARPESRLEIEERLLSAPGENSTDEDPLLGTRLGSYRLVRLVGRGGMGDVYLAKRDGEYEQEVAVKVVGTGFGAREITRRFRAERQILARLSHPHIAQLLDGGTAHDGRPYLVMQFIDGLPITRYCDQAGLSVRQRLELFVTVCSAVQFAHSKLVVHRDLKPSNILVEADGRVKLLDFGIAKLLDPEEELTARTRPEMRLMSPEHAAPEQVRGEPVTTATDVWALGLLLYEILAGRRPFPGKSGSRRELEAAICQSSPVPPSEAVGPRAAADRSSTVSRLRRRLRGDLDTIVSKALRKEPERRYASVLQLAEDVTRHLEGLPIRARPETAGYRLGKFVRRHAWSVAAAGLGACLLAAFLILTLLQSRVAAQERDTAQEVTRVLVGLFEAADPSTTAAGRSLTVAELLDQQTDRVIADLESQPAIQARLRHVLGKVHRALLHWDRARSLLESALEQQSELAGPEDPLTVAILHDLAVLSLRDRGPEASLPLLRESLARQQRLFGSADPRVARALQDLASALPAKGPERAALRLEALDIVRGLGKADERLASALNDLGISRYEEGRYQEAIALYREAEEILLAIRSPGHPMILKVKNNLASVFSSMGDYGEARTLLEEIVAARRKIYGSESFEVAISLNNLAVNATRDGENGLAEETFREALEIWTRLLGSEQPQTANTARNLGRVLELQGRYQEALDFLRQAAAGALDEVGVQYLEGQIAVVERRLGNSRASLEVLQRVADWLTQALPASHPYIADSRVWLGDALLGLDAAERAEAHYQLALASREAGLPTGHPKIAEALCGLARAWAHQGRRGEAREAFERCLPVFSEWGLAHFEELRAAQEDFQRTVRPPGAGEEDHGEESEGAGSRTQATVKKPRARPRASLDA